MSSSVNKVILIGRLGKDPEVRNTQSGQSVANMSIAVDETYKDKQSGEKQKKTEWINLVVWGPSVENFVQPYLHKGDMVYVEGKLQTRSWEKDGTTKYITEVNVTDIKGLVTGTGNDNQQSNNRPASNNRSAARPATQQRQAPSTQLADEDIPF